MNELLRPHQIQPVQHLLGLFKNFRGLVDASDTGTGKTYVGAAVGASLNVPTLVVCPAIVKTAWKKAAAHFGTEFSIVSFDKLRMGDSGFGSWRHQAAVDAGRKVSFKCQCCQRDLDLDGPNYFRCYTNALGIHCLVSKKSVINYGDFSFHPGVRFVIIDEGHRCGGLDSLNADILIATRRQNIPTLVLSATLAESPLQMRALGFVLGLHTLTPRGGLGFYEWAARYGCRREEGFGGYKWFAGREKQDRIMKEIHNQIIPARGVRVRTSDIPGFPERDISACEYDLDAPERVDALYSEMQQALERLKSRCGSDVAPDLELTKILRARQKIELLKVPIFAELATDCLDKGQSVGIFCNFRETLLELQKRLKAPIIDGSNKGDERDRIIEGFQRNDFRLLLINSEAGGVSCSLQDLDGNHPRIGLVSPPQKAVTFRQLCGRFHREGGKSPCFYRVVLAANSVEVKIKRALDSKLRCLDMLNDGDLLP